MFLDEATETAGRDPPGPQELIQRQQKPRSESLGSKPTTPHSRARLFLAGSLARSETLAKLGPASREILPSSRRLVKDGASVAAEALPTAQLYPGASASCGAPAAGPQFDLTVTDWP